MPLIDTAHSLFSSLSFFRDPDIAWPPTYNWFSSIITISAWYTWISARCYIRQLAEKVFERCDVLSERGSARHRAAAPKKCPWPSFCARSKCDGIGKCTLLLKGHSRLPCGTRAAGARIDLPSARRRRPCASRMSRDLFRHIWMQVWYICISLGKYLISPISP